MPDVGDAGIAATVGAAITGAVIAAKEAIARRRKRKSEPPDLDETDDSTLAGQLSSVRARLREHGRRIEEMAQQRIQDRQEVTMLKAAVEARVSKIEESLDELDREFTRSRTISETLLPIIKGQVEELRKELREDRKS